MYTPLKHLSWSWFKLIGFIQTRKLRRNIFLILTYIIVRPSLIILIQKRFRWWLVLLVTTTSRYFRCFINDNCIWNCSIIVYLLCNIFCCTPRGLCYTNCGVSGHIPNYFITTIGKIATQPPTHIILYFKLMKHKQGDKSNCYRFVLFLFLCIHSR